MDEKPIQTGAVVLILSLLGVIGGTAATGSFRAAGPALAAPHGQLERTAPRPQGLMLQNLSESGRLTVNLDVYDSSGEHAWLKTFSGIPPLGGIPLYIPGLLAAAPEPLESPSYVVSADRPIAAISQMARSPRGSMLSGSMTIGDLLVAPFGSVGAGGIVTGIAILDTRSPGAIVPTPMEVVVDLRSADGFESIASTTLLTSTRPDRLTFVDLDSAPDFSGVGDHVEGFLMLRAPEPFGALAMLNTVDPGSVLHPGVASVSALNVESSAPRWYVPLIRNDHFGSTRISVVNVSTEWTSVLVRYVGAIGSICEGESIYHGTESALVPPNGSVIFDQSRERSDTGSPGLPSGCFGSAVIEATGAPVLAAVLDVDHSSARVTAAGYEALSDLDVEREVAVPLVRNHHTSMDLVTGIQVMNADSDFPATVTLSLMAHGDDPEGIVTDLVPGGPDRTVVIPPHGSFAWYMPTTSGADTWHGEFGAAFLSSDKAIAVVVNEVSLSGYLDSGLYVGRAVRFR